MNVDLNLINNWMIKLEEKKNCFTVYINNTILPNIFLMFLASCNYCFFILFLLNVYFIATLTLESYTYNIDY